MGDSIQGDEAGGFDWHVRTGEVPLSASLGLRLLLQILAVWSRLVPGSVYLLTWAAWICPLGWAANVELETCRVGPTLTCAA